MDYGCAGKMLHSIPVLGHERVIHLHLHTKADFATFMPRDKEIDKYMIS
jgi:hypothetical protein